MRPGKISLEEYSSMSGCPSQGHAADMHVAHNAVEDFEELNVEMELDHP